MRERNKHNNIVNLEKTKLNTIEVLISKALIGSCINHDKDFLVNNVSREYLEIKVAIEDSKKIIYYMWNILYKSNRNVLYQF